jgi:hypothetical protein
MKQVPAGCPMPLGRQVMPSWQRQPCIPNGSRPGQIAVLVTAIAWSIPCCTVHWLLVTGVQTGCCKMGEACPYAHNVLEYWLHPTRWVESAKG